jgi:hypothetical protein
MVTITDGACATLACSLPASRGLSYFEVRCREDMAMSREEENDNVMLQCDLQAGLVNVCAWAWWL